MPPSPAPAGDADRLYLVIVREGSSSIFALPATGVCTIGRAPECDLAIDDASMSRRHARLVIAGSDVQVVDQGSRNGTLVNGQPIEASRALLPGDTITLGQVTLILFHERATKEGSRILAAEALRPKLIAEVERALLYQRPIAVVVATFEGVPHPEAVEAAAIPCLRRVDHAGWFDANHLVLLLPELGEAEAREVAEDLLESAREHTLTARCGIALCPTEGADGETLLAAARAAADTAKANEAATAKATATRLEIGDQVAIVADPAMHRLYELIRRLAPSELPVLITGGTGTGKELAARAVHEWSPRAKGPFVALNCAAIQDTLVESELFGHERGAFTGAMTQKTGLLESAKGGTLFLDEIGELSLQAQAKLLRALEVGRITRVGDVKERPIDLRVVAATHRDLSALVTEGRFRQDLLFRLNPATVVLPPLKDRPREIPILAKAFLDEASKGNPEAPRRFSIGALHALLTRPWPGNVRELRNLMRLVAATVREEAVQPWHLVDPGAPLPAAADVASAPEPLIDGAPAAAFTPVADELRDLERRRMIEALEASGGQQKKAARLLQMPIRTFTLKVKKYGLNPRGGAE